MDELASFSTSDQCAAASSTVTVALTSRLRFLVAWRFHAATVPCPWPPSINLYAVNCSGWIRGRTWA